MRATTFGDAVLALAACLALARPGEVRAQAATEVPLSAAEIRVDGRLDEPAWSDAAVVRLAFEWYPGDNTPAPIETTCLLLGGAGVLHVACRAADPAPAQIRGHYAARDEAEGDDEISILLDPAGTSRRGYRFAVTALGVQYDALYSEDEGDDETWDATWRSAARRTSTGYVVEVDIPYRALRRPRPSGRGRPWGLVIVRSWPRGADYRFGSVRNERDDSCLLCQALPLRGLEGAPTGRGGRLQPTLTTSLIESDEGGELEREAETSIGASGRWSASSSTRLSLTVNPDFSQVEADAAEFEVNRRFALSFPEKRPFFLDDADFFDVSDELLQTRSVVDPAAGAKATWQRGRQALGALATLDRRNSLILPGNQGSERISTDDEVAGLVGRYRVDLPGASSVGAFASGRFAADYHNVVGSLDGAFRLGRSHRVRVLAALSRADDEPEVEARTGREGSFGGIRWNARYDFAGRDWAAEAGFRGITPGFRSDAGELQRVDLLGPEFQLARIFRSGGGGWYDEIQLDVEGQRLTDFDGAVIDEKLELAAAWVGPLHSELEIAHAWRREAFGDRLFERQVTDIEAQVRPSGAVAIGASAAFGDEIDADNQRLGRGLQLGATARLRLGPSFLLGLGQRMSRLAVPAGEVFRAWLTDAQVTYHFGLHLFVRTIVQYRRIARDPAVWIEPVEPRSNRLFLQALVSYEVTPETVVYAGYAGTTSDFRGLDLGPQHRSFFLKLGYGFQF